MTKTKRREAEPETRVGICCGDSCKADQHSSGTWNYALLFKVQGISRYRCDRCFEAETGRRHHLAPPRSLPGHEKPRHWFDANTDGFSDGGA